MLLKVSKLWLNLISLMIYFTRLRLRSLHFNIAFKIRTSEFDIYINSSFPALFNSYLIFLNFQLKLNSRLRSFNNIEDQFEGSYELSRHSLMANGGVFGQDEENIDRFCKLRPSKCLHGLYD